MIIIKLTGGLGNQLFQLALGLSLSERSKNSLKLDLSELRYDPLRKFALDFLITSWDQAESEEITRIKRGNLKDRIKRFFSIVRPYYEMPTIKESAFFFDSNFPLYRSRHVHLEGHWQSERYFSEISPEIRSLFKGLSKSETFRSYEERINGIPSVSIHYRRGDYIQNPETTKYHGIPTDTYYHEALKHILGVTTNAKALVFSDDKQWIKDNLQLPIPFELVEGLEDYEEMILMSKCDHQIIANSSFSWWGAWLNENPDKIVIAPKQWFANEDMQAQTQDLIPETWLRM